MRPESGFINPSASFRMVLLPEPATPKSALVSPCGSRNEMSSSTCLVVKCQRHIFEADRFGCRAAGRQQARCFER